MVSNVRFKLCEQNTDKKGALVQKSQKVRFLNELKFTLRV